MKNVLLSSLLSVSLLATHAQDIVFSTYMTEYAPIENGTYAVVYAWDDPSFSIPLGFDLTFFGETTNSIFMLEDFLGGIFALNIPVDLLDMAIATTADLTDPEYFNSGTLSAPITYVTVGQPGSRICKVQWENAGFYSEVVEGSANNLVNLQLWIYEQGVIEVHHGQNSVKEPEVALGDGWTCGVLDGLNITSEEPTVTGAYLLGGDPEDATFISTTDLNELFFASLEAIPAAGRVYRFGPDGAINTLELERDELRVWPLTANEVINFTSGANGVSFYDVYDLSGKIIAQGSFAGRYTLPVSHLQNGIYLVNLRCENNAHTFKVVKR